jgi:hypothetical protein
MLRKYNMKHNNITDIKKNKKALNELSTEIL